MIGHSPGQDRRVFDARLTSLVGGRFRVPGEGRLNASKVRRAHTIADG